MLSSHGANGAYPGEHCPPARVPDWRWGWSSPELCLSGQEANLVAVLIMLGEEVMVGILSC